MSKSKAVKILSHGLTRPEMKAIIANELKKDFTLMYSADGPSNDAIKCAQGHREYLKKAASALNKKTKLTEDDMAILDWCLRRVEDKTVGELTLQELRSIIREEVQAIMRNSRAKPIERVFNRERFSE